MYEKRTASIQKLKMHLMVCKIQYTGISRNSFLDIPVQCMLSIIMLSCYAHRTSSVSILQCDLKCSIHHKHDKIDFFSRVVVTVQSLLLY